MNLKTLTILVMTLVSVALLAQRRVPRDEMPPRTPLRRSFSELAMP
jgi:hypothetical protein